MLVDHFYLKFKQATIEANGNLNHIKIHTYWQLVVAS